MKADEIRRRLNEAKTAEEYSKIAWEAHGLARGLEHSNGVLSEALRAERLKHAEVERIWDRDARAAMQTLIGMIEVKTSEVVPAAAEYADAMEAQRKARREREAP
jgi:hypothetical protein